MGHTAITLLGRCTTLAMPYPMGLPCYRCGAPIIASPDVPILVSSDAEGQGKVTIDVQVTLSRKG